MSPSSQGFESQPLVSKQFIDNKYIFPFCIWYLKQEENVNFQKSYREISSHQQTHII